MPNSYEYERKWREAVNKISELVDFETTSKWEQADILADLWPDGFPDVRNEIRKFYDAIGLRLKPATLTTYRETALAWPKDWRIENKGFWLHAQARYKSNRRWIVSEATSEAHLRELLGHRNPYRIDTEHVYRGLRDIESAKRLLTADLVRLWMQDEYIRDLFVTELSTAHGMLYVPFKESVFA